MSHKVDVTCSPGNPSMWRVTVDGSEVVSFAGPRAEELAESSRRDLAYFLDVMSRTDDAGRRPEADGPGGPARHDDPKP
jgi:hypothetical protein